MKKLLVVAFCAIIILVCLSACGNEIEYSGAENHLNLEGEINVMVQGFPGFQRYADLFMHYHPNVQINLESQGWITDTAQQTALNTRLMADPPDIFFGPNPFPEKMNMAALFFDFNSFLDGPRGINRNDYFDNIFRAMEDINGSLYSLPLLVTLEGAFLNTRLFEGIGVDATQIASITLDEELDYFLRIAEAFPDENLFMYNGFSIGEVFRRLPMYDLETRQVFVNTPEMYARIERAMQIPVNPEWVTFTPEGIQAFEVVGALESDALRTSQNMFKTNTGVSVIDNVVPFFLEGHPNFQFTHSVNRARIDGGERPFATGASAFLLRGGQNTDLAWEFLRFMIEVVEHPQNHVIFEGLRPLVNHPLLPVNKARLDNEVEPHIRNAHERVWRSVGMANHVELSQEEHEELQVAAAMDFFRDTLSSVNARVRNPDFYLDQNLFQPEIWLLYSGQQTLAETLERIHNRLVIYVNE